MTTPTRVTVEQFLAMEDEKPYLELINGEMVQKAMPGPKHSAAVIHVGTELTLFVRQHPIARVDTELRHRSNDQDWVSLPDICVTLRDRWPKGATSAVEVMPDLAIEVLSPDDRAGRVAERVDFYTRSGTSLIWVIDPELEHVTVYRPGAAPEFHRNTDTLDGAPVLPGFRLDLAELFRVVRDE
jgi:Uma2 family endonuclease